MQAFPVAGQESASGQMESREQSRYIRVIMEQLPARQRQVVELKIWDDLPDEEIEQRAGLKKANIKVTVSRARRVIKERYLKWERNENR